LTGYKIYSKIGKRFKGGYDMPIRILGEKFYRTEDLVDILPLGIKAIQLYIRTGKLPGRRIGKFYYVSQASLKNFLRGRDKADVKLDLS